MLRYPKATWLGNGQSGGSFTSGPRKVVLHTTETRTLPGYQGGATAPHLTFAPASRVWYQHTELDVAARALRNEAGGEETNRDGALQVEIICYSAKNIAEGVNGLWVGDLSQAALDELREFIEWATVPIVWPGRQAFSYSQANEPGFRLTLANWDAYNGVLGHQHVPENTHWDPGALDWAYLMREEDDMIPEAHANTLKYLHEAFDGNIGVTREEILHQLIDDSKSDIITRSELVAAINGIPRDGITVDQALNELVRRIENR